MYIQNTSKRLLHLAYRIQDKDGRFAGRYLQADDKIPGIPPGSHLIDPDNARIVREHKSNRMFFDTGMIKICEGDPPRGEQVFKKEIVDGEERKVPLHFRADKAAILQAQAQKSERVKSAK